jgi:hypothetical protein
MRAALTVFAATALAGLVLTTPSFGQTPPAASAAPTPAPPMGPTPMNVRTTGDLLALCNTPDTDTHYPNAIGLCVGYMSGALDYHLADTYRNKRGRRVCLPATPPTRGEARRMFIAWAQEHPQSMDEWAVNGVMRFFIASFPCKR